MFIITYVITYIRMLCMLQPVYTQGSAENQLYTEQTSCLNITLTIAQLAFLMILEQNHKCNTQTYIASHPECCKTD